MSFSKLSHDLTQTLHKNDKKSQGIYFTPPESIQMILRLLKKHKNTKQIKTILEPSYGSGEFITAIQNMMNKRNYSITGVEYNQTIYEKTKELSSKKISLCCDDFMNFSSERNYDLIVGNPPYFVMKKKEVPEDYYSYFEGRPNIFILFIIKCCKLLCEEGILCFVLPKSFINCSYYNKTRSYICENFQILEIEKGEGKYLETQQETIIFMIQKINKENINNEDYVIEKGTHIIFGMKDDIENMKSIMKDSKTLDEMGFQINVGKVVWNQCKPKLSTDSSKTRLVYSGDLQEGDLQVSTFKNENKKNYINQKGLTTPCLAMNRGYGVGNYKMTYSIIDGSFPYLLENHVLSITPKQNKSKLEELKLYKKIIDSLQNENTKKFIKLYAGNNALNTTEMAHWIPIFDEI